MIGTSIEWSDDTLNPWIGCAKVSAACTHCYAETMDKRVQFGGQTNWGVHAPRLIRVDKAVAELRAIARRADREGRPRRVFIASMSDVFEAREDLVAPRARLWEALLEINRFRVRVVPMFLTKRAAGLLAWQRLVAPEGLPWWCWVGVTVENQAAADERLLLLCEVATAGVRFLSMEPLLGPVNLGLLGTLPRSITGSAYVLTYDRIHWVIAGGESGPKARPSHPDWFRALRDECALTETPFFFKQWGEFGPPNGPDGVNAARAEWEKDGVVTQVFRVGKKAAGRLLDGREHNDVPDVER